MTASHPDRQQIEVVYVDVAGRPRKGLPIQKRWKELLEHPDDVEPPHE